MAGMGAMSWGLALFLGVLAIAGVFPEEALLCAVMGIEPAQIESIGFVLAGANLVLLLHAARLRIG